MIIPQCCALVLGICGFDTKADYWNDCTPPAIFFGIIGTQSTSIWPMDCWLVGCGDHEDFLLAHERRVLCYIPLHSIWLMTFMLFAWTSYLTCTQHTSEFQNVKSTVQYQHTLLLPFICQGHGVPLHELDMIWCYDSLHTCRAISHGGIMYFASFNHDRSSNLAKILFRQSQEAPLLWVKELMNLPTDLYERKKMQHLTCKELVGSESPYISRGIHC